MTEDEKYMQIALKLALRGIGDVEPNPAVGCIIVKANQIIGKGWHRKFGQPHAEVNAIEDCKNLGANPAGATMYVTLEPCCIQGKTPPCTEAIIAAKLSRVVAAVIDPSDGIWGEGVQHLRDAGIEVLVGTCQQEAKLLNAPFFKFVKTHRPWIILKWAQSIDGKLAWQNPEKGKNRISNGRSRRDVHDLRRSVQGILVGIDTVIADNPQLTIRPSKGRYPVRIVLDSNLRIPLKSKVLNKSNPPTLIVTRQWALGANGSKAERLAKKGAQILTVKDSNGRCDIEELLDELGKQGIQQLLVEGGPKVLTSFLEKGLADAVKIYIAPNILGADGTAGISEAMTQITKSARLHYIDIEEFEGDVCISGLLKQIED